MKVSTKGRNALRLMIDIGMNSKDGSYVSLKAISVRQGISVKYLEQIVAPLTRAGMLRSARGAQGGYRLKDDPKDYTAGQILRAMEGSLAPIACLDFMPNECDQYDACPTIEFWEGMNRVITEYVDGVTLEELINQQMRRSQRGGTLGCSGCKNA